ncbi:MAG: hypothetical protein HW401_53 [Parcubacteria group bacterium]|nr:hypothetical protein [Parcubacteria group bacterium]
MFKNNKVILLVLLIIILAFLGYRYAFNKDISSGNSDLAVDSNEGASAQAVIGKDLMAAISKLKSLTLDDKFFQDPIFVSLNDFSVPIADQDVGRGNPFSPIGISGGAAASDKKAGN